MAPRALTPIPDPHTERLSPTLSSLADISGLAQSNRVNEDRFAQNDVEKKDGPVQFNGNEDHDHEHADAEDVTNDEDLAYVPSARTLALYNHWMEKKTIFVHRKSKKIPLRQFTVCQAASEQRYNQVYEDLLDLMIYSQRYKIGSTFEQAVLREWQGLDWSGKYGFAMPDLSIVEKAFKELPRRHILLGYLVMHFTHAWYASDDYMLDDYEPCGPVIERFLFGICWHRYVYSHIKQTRRWGIPCDRSTQMDVGCKSNGTRAYMVDGLVDALLWRWCEFHDHKSEKEQQECHRWRDSLPKKGWKIRWLQGNEQQTKRNLRLKDTSVNAFPRAQANESDRRKSSNEKGECAREHGSYEPSRESIIPQDEFTRSTLSQTPQARDQSRPRNDSEYFELSSVRVHMSLKRSSDSSNTQGQQTDNRQGKQKRRSAVPVVPRITRRIDDTSDSVSSDNIQVPLRGTNLTSRKTSIEIIDLCSDSDIC